MTRDCRARATRLGMVLVLLLGIGSVALWHFGEPRERSLEEIGEGVGLDDKPSIAVMPFANMSGDGQQEYFSEGFTDELITDLGNLSGLLVIGRNSTFSYGGESVTAKDVSRELGVRYVLQGSVLKAENRITITAQLIEGATGHRTWAGHYDADPGGVFGLQSEISEGIAAALAVPVAEGEVERLRRIDTSSPEAHDAFLRGMQHYRRAAPRANGQARRMFERALEHDPAYAAAYLYLGWTYFQEWAMQWREDPETLDRALALAQRSQELDGSLAGCRLLVGYVHVWKGRWEDAVQAAEQAIRLAPGDAHAYAAMGEILTWADRGALGIAFLETAMRLDPRHPVDYLWGLGHAYYVRGRYEEAISSLKTALTLNPDWIPAHVYLAAAYWESNLKEEARAAILEAKRLSPQGSEASLRRRLPYKDAAVRERLTQSLLAAGLGTPPVRATGG